MKNFKSVALCAFNLILVLSAMLLPLKSANAFAEDATSPPVCKDGYEYVESAGKCYKKCQEGWERNLETNRCRKVRTEETSADTPADTATSATSPTESVQPATSCKEGYEYVESADKCYKKCQEGYERNSETNRCRKIQVEESESPQKSSSSPKTSTKNNSNPTSCKDGYEYVASAGKCYKACSEGQVRNPDTNRCKKASSTKPETKACQEGYERNPDTNRCRKIKNNTGADYSVDVPNTGSVPGSFTAGGIIIALIIAGAAFATFQYRQEIKKFIKKYFKKA